jgi:hypothetical protein
MKEVLGGAGTTDFLNDVLYYESNNFHLTRHLQGCETEGELLHSIQVWNGRLAVRVKAGKLEYRKDVTDRLGAVVKRAKKVGWSETHGTSPHELSKAELLLTIRVQEKAREVSSRRNTEGSARNNESFRINGSEKERRHVASQWARAFSSYIYHWGEDDWYYLIPAIEEVLSDSESTEFLQDLMYYEATRLRPYLNLRGADTVDELMHDIKELENQLVVRMTFGKLRYRAHFIERLGAVVKQAKLLGWGDKP